MKNNIFYISLFFILTSLTSWSQEKQSAKDYFNTASQQYIDNKKIDALKTIEEGLAYHQEDQKLLDLAEKLLKEDEDQQNQQQKDQKEQQDKKKDEKEENKDQNKEDKKDGESEKDKKEKQDQKDQKDKEEKGKNEKEKSEEEKKKEQEAQQKKMNPSQKNQAMQDLKALENKEKALLKRINLKKEKGTPVKTDKDW